MGFYTGVDGNKEITILLSMLQCTRLHNNQYSVMKD